MAVEHPNLRLSLSSAPPALDLAAAAIAGVAAVCDLDALARNDLATAVAELVKNVVLHAYDGEEGPLELEVRVREEEIEVTVRDHGIGIRPHLGERTQPHTGIGMPIVHLLSRRVTYTNLPGGGTDVCLELAMPGLVAIAAASPLAADPAGDPREGQICLSLSPAPVSSAVLARVLAVLAPSSPAALAADLAREAIPDLALDLCLAPGETSLELRARHFELPAAERLLAAHAEPESGSVAPESSRREGTAALSLSLPLAAAD